MAEQWIRWEPISGLAAKYYVESIVDDLEELKIVLSDAQNQKRKVQVIFEYSSGVYRRTKKNLTHEFNQQVCPDFFADWTFFKVSNSTYIQWLSQESLGIYDSINFIHFSFVAADSIIDVRATNEPKVEFINTD